MKKEKRVHAKGSKGAVNKQEKTDTGGADAAMDITALREKLGDLAGQISAAVHRSIAELPPLEIPIRSLGTILGAARTIQDQTAGLGKPVASSAGDPPASSVVRPKIPAEVYRTQCKLDRSVDTVMACLELVSQKLAEHMESLEYEGAGSDACGVLNLCDAARVSLHRDNDAAWKAIQAAFGLPQS